MEQSKDTAPVRTLTSGHFEGVAISAIEYGDQPLFFLRQIGAALGYANGVLRPMVTRDWAEHLTVGVHLLRLDGAALASAKAAYPDEIEPRAPSLVLLTERGLYRVLMLSRKPAALAFQDWLEGVVLPSIRKTGSYSAPGTSPATAELPEIPAPLGQAPYRAVRELLLAEKASGRELTALRQALSRRPSKVQVPDGAQLTTSPPARPPEPRMWEGYPELPPRGAQYTTRHQIGHDEAMADLWSRTEGLPGRFLRVTIRGISGWWDTSYWRARTVLHDLRERGWIRLRWASPGDNRGSLLEVVTSEGAWPGVGGVR